MLKKLNDFLNVLIGVVVGVFVGHSAYVIFDYRVHPDLYAMYSAPWYTSILLYGIFAAIVLAATIIVKIIIRKNMGKD